MVTILVSPAGPLPLHQVLDQLVLRQSMMGEFIIIQECIPVGCVSPASVAISTGGGRVLPLGPGVCLWVQGGGVSDSGSRGSAFGSKGGGVGCLPLGPGGGVVDTPFTTPSPFTTPPFHHKARPKTNTCENITLPQTSVNIQT